jgi:hypothetical protein
MSMFIIIIITKDIHLGGAIQRLPPMKGGRQDQENLPFS